MERQVGNASCKFLIRCSRCWIFFTHLSGSPGFSSLPTAVTSLIVIFEQTLFLTFSASSWLSLFTFRDSCPHFMPSSHWLWLHSPLTAGLPLQRIWVLEKEKTFCAWCTQDLALWTASCPIWATRPTLPVVRTLLPKYQPSLQTLILNYPVEEGTDILFGKLAVSSELSWPSVQASVVAHMSFFWNHSTCSFVDQYL